MQDQQPDTNEKRPRGRWRWTRWISYVLGAIFAFGVLIPAVMMSTMGYPLVDDAEGGIIGELRGLFSVNINTFLLLIIVVQQTAIHWKLHDRD